MTERKPWISEPVETGEPRTLESVREAILQCLAETRGSTPEAEADYLDSVLARTRANGKASWADFYRVLGVLRDDALAAGVDEARVRDHVARLQRILEQVTD